MAIRPSMPHNIPDILRVSPVRNPSVQLMVLSSRMGIW